MRQASRITAYDGVRSRTVRLTVPLSAEDCCVQSMPDASPAKWHLGHTTWFFETFVLERMEPSFTPFDPAFRTLFNSYYNAVGDRHPRPGRGLLTRPSLDEIAAYRADVDGRMGRLLPQVEGEFADLVTLGLHHEQQHQELLLTDIKHLFSCNPVFPAYRPPKTFSGVGPAPALVWMPCDGGLTAIGHSGDSFHFDNEGPRHTVWLEPFALASRLVTNREYAEFIASGGYTEPRLWLAEGWDWVATWGRTAPLYWHASDDGWREFTLAGLLPLQPDRPAVHLSYYEADAYARWAGARLPTEAEWEKVAAGSSPSGHFAEEEHFHPLPAPTDGMTQLFGDAWEWTSSSYAAYPGFRPACGAVGEYNGKFMVNQYVLRGGSCLTPGGHMRPTYRNFFPAKAAWQMSGIRLALDR